MKSTRILPLSLCALTMGPVVAQRYIAVEPALPQPRVHFIDTSVGALVEYDVLPLSGIPSGFWGALSSVYGIARVGGELWVTHPESSGTSTSALTRIDIATAAPLGTTSLLDSGFTRLAAVADGVWIKGVGQLQKRSFAGTLLTTIRVPGILDVTTDCVELLALRSGLLGTPQTIARFDIAGNPLGSLTLDIPAGPGPFDASTLNLRASNGNFLLAGVARIYERDRATGALVQTLNLSQFEQEAFELPDGRLLSINDSSCDIVDVTGPFASASPVPTTTGRRFIATALFDAGGPNVRRFCPSGPNSSGQSATIAMRGTTRTSDGALWLDVLGGPPQAPGLFVYGVAGASQPVGNGTLCVGGGAGVVRTATLGVFDASGQRSSVALVYANLPANAAVVAGSTWSFQYVFRDAAPAGATVDLSDAIELTFD